MAYVDGTTHTHGAWLSATPETFSYVLVNGAGNDRALFVIVHWEDSRVDGIPTAVTYGGQSLTKIADIAVDDSFDAGTQVWWINDANLPSSNGSNTVSVTFASNSNASAQAEYTVLEYSGAGQSAPGNVETATYLNPAVDALSLTVTPAEADSIILGAMTTGYVANVVGQTGTLRFEVDGTSSTGAVAEYQNTGTAAVDMEITLNGTGNRATFVAFELEMAPTVETFDSVTIAPVVAKPASKHGAPSVSAVSSSPAPAAKFGSGSATAVVEAPRPSARLGTAAAPVVARVGAPAQKLSVASVTAAPSVAVPASKHGVSSVTVAPVVPPDESPATLPLRINCGSETEHVDGSSNTWIADAYYSTPSNTFSTADPIAGTTEDPLFQSERSTTASGGEYAVTYTLPVPVGVEVEVNVLLAELWHTVAGNRLFDVEIGGVEVVADLDLVAVAGHDTAHIVSRSFTTVADTITVVVRNGSLDRAKINAIEVVEVSSSSVDSVTVAAEVPAPSSKHAAPSVTVAPVVPTPASKHGVGSVTVAPVVPAIESADDLTVQVTGLTQFTSAVGGSPTPSGFTLTVTNESDAAIRFQAKATCDWLMLTDTFGTLDPSESVMIGVIADTDELAEGAYSALVCVVGMETHDHKFHAVPVRAEIGTPAAATATLYIDYESGSDANDGLSEGGAWKHLPWDDNATGAAAAYSPAAGNEFILKGGVSYRGSITIGDPGTSGQPIVIDGNSRGTWGDGPAIIDGSELIGGWTDNLDGTFTADISAAKWFDKAPLGLRPFDGEQVMTNAQWPVKPTEKFRYDDLTNWQLADDTYNGQAAQSDPPVPMVPGYVEYSGFAALPTDWWVHAYVYGWAIQNRVGKAKITSFDPGTNRAYFDHGDFTWTDSQPPRFVVVNSPYFLDDPGEFWIDEGAEEITAIPYGSNPDAITGCTIPELVDVYDDYCKLRGLILQRAGGSADYQGSAVACFTGGGVGITMEGCQVRWCPSQRSTVDFRSGNTDTLIDGCAFYQNILGREITITNGIGGGGGTDGTIRNSVLFACGGTGIYTSAADGVTVDNNLVLRVLAVHANGISAYSGSTDVTITRNTVLEGQIAITLQLTGTGANALVAHNYADTKESFLGFGSTMAIYSLSSSAGIKVLNNTFLNVYGQALSLGTNPTHSPATLGLEVRNNILEGANGGADPDSGVGITSSHNVFLAEWDMTWPYDATDIMETDKAVVFADHTANDYTLAPGSPAIDSGYDTGLTLVPAVGQRDRGAFEFQNPNAVDSVTVAPVVPVPGSKHGVASVTVAPVVPAPTTVGDEVDSITVAPVVPVPGVKVGSASVTVAPVVPVPAAKLGSASVFVVPVAPAPASGSGAPSVTVAPAVAAPASKHGVPSVTVAPVVPEAADDMPGVASVTVAPVVPVPSSRHGVASVTVALVVPETNELLLEPVPTWRIAVGLSIVKGPAGEWIRYYPAAGGSKTIRAIVQRNLNYVVEGNAFRLPVRIRVSLHPTEGVAVPTTGDEVEFLRRKDNQPERFRIARIDSSGRTGLWMLETEAGTYA